MKALWLEHSGIRTRGTRSSHLGFRVLFRFRL